jgi:hypothetical protein
VSDLTSPCADCRMNTTPDDPALGHWYMVTDEVWAAAGMRNGYLCVGCLENRIGRHLNGGDLQGIPVNFPGLFRDTERLAELKKDRFSGATADEMVQILLHKTPEEVA